MAVLAGFLVGPPLALLYVFITQCYVMMYVVCKTREYIDLFQNNTQPSVCSEQILNLWSLFWTRYIHIHTLLHLLVCTS